MDYTKIKAKVLRAKPILTDSETEKLLGTLLTPDAVKTLIQSDTDVYCAKTGDCLLKFRKGLASRDTINTTFECLYHAADLTDNRGLAAGLLTRQEAERVLKTHTSQGKLLWPEGKDRVARVQYVNGNGRVSTRSRSRKIHSGIIGFMEDSARFPYCRMTAFTAENFKRYEASFPMIRLVDEVYRQLMPEPYARQKQRVAESNADFIIPGTAFTTVTVNRNWQTACHTDKGDFLGGFGNLVALRRGKFTGGYFTLPQYGVGVDMQNGDVLLVDVHRIHGNTPIVKQTVGATRLSLVMYYREGIERCGTQTEELRKAKQVMQHRMKL